MSTIFGDDDLGRRLAFDELRPRRAEERAERRVDPVDGPLRHQRPVRHLVDPALPVDRVPHELAEEVHVALGHLLAVVDGAEAVRLELLLDGVRRLPRRLHLEERLNGIEPRGRLHLARGLHAVPLPSATR
jgi:hypothetical protein